ncbi:hypothetical protein [Burkholderia stagnalis]|uniref:hypothetical protein n=1 Tax=Burkholderia stagnalis TaxID=1503054 RepID=UPI000F57DFC3|nr:hypothetical protein [Burkholderia stagnalis]
MDTASQPDADCFIMSWYNSVLLRVPWAKDVFQPPTLNQGMALQVVRYGQNHATEEKRRLVTQLEATDETDGTISVGTFDFQSRRSAFELQVGTSSGSLKRQLSLVVEQKETENSHTLTCEITNHSDPSKNVRYSVTTPLLDGAYTGSEPLLLKLDMDGETLEDTVTLNSKTTPPIIDKLHELIGRRTPTIYPDNAFGPVLIQEIWGRDLTIETMRGKQPGIGTVIASPLGLKCILMTILAGALLGFVGALIARIMCWEGSAH